MSPISHKQRPISNLHSAPLFSIIIPVYNTSAYLESCIQSLIDQDETSFEIIAVDDGSTDDSRQVLETISQQDTRLRVFSKKNGGQGSARNLALTKARGPFVIFVDSDDTVAADLLSQILPHLSDSDLDIVSFGIDFRNDSGRTVAKRAPTTSFCSTGEDIFIDAMLDRNFLTSVCNKVYRRSLLVENSIDFPELRAYEDSVFSRQVALYARKVLFLKKSLYFALIRSGSTSRGMTMLSFTRAAELIALEREMFCTSNTPVIRQAAFRAHVARFLAYLIILSAFRIDDPVKRTECHIIADNAGFSDCATDRKALALLGPRVKAQIFLARYPKILRIMAVVARRFNFVPY